MRSFQYASRRCHSTDRVVLEEEPMSGGARRRERRGRAMPAPGRAPSAARGRARHRGRAATPTRNDRERSRTAARTERRTTRRRRPQAKVAARRRHDQRAHDQPESRASTTGRQRLLDEDRRSTRSAGIRPRRPREERRAAARHDPREQVGGDDASVITSDADVLGRRVGRLGGVDRPGRRDQEGVERLKDRGSAAPRRAAGPSPRSRARAASTPARR